MHPKPLHLALLNLEEQQFYSDLLLEERAPHPISKGELRHTAEEIYFACLYPRSWSFSHFPQLVTIGEGRIVN